MTAWTLTAALALGALHAFFTDPLWRTTLFGYSGELRNLRRVIAAFQDRIELIASGTVTSAEEETQRWHRLPEPWQTLAGSSLASLRARGAPVLPTLRRLAALAEAHHAAWNEARARASQALSQALICAALVPLFGTSLYCLLPEISARPWLWTGCCACALALAAAGAAWMLLMAEKARWGGLPARHRAWPLAALCAGERFLAELRGGAPADIAWIGAHGLLGSSAPGLAEAWGPSLWHDPASAGSGLGPTERTLADVGAELRRGAQASLMEGRPCAERSESVLGALRSRLDAQIQQELALLPSRALLPLFACVAPALFGLLAAALALTAGAAP